MNRVRFPNTGVFPVPGLLLCPDFPEKVLAASLSPGPFMPRLKLPPEFVVQPLLDPSAQQNMQAKLPNVPSCLPSVTLFSGTWHLARKIHLYRTPPLPSPLPSGPITAVEIGPHSLVVGSNIFSGLPGRPFLSGGPGAWCMGPSKRHLSQRQ